MTLAESNLSDARQHIEHAIRGLGSILIWKTHGHEKFTHQQKVLMLDAVAILMNLGVSLGDEYMKAKE